MQTCRRVQHRPEITFTLHVLTSGHVDSCTTGLKDDVLYPIWYHDYQYSIMSHTIKQKQDLILRAKRIQGQVDALVRALDEERDCSEVLHIMSAARGAMNSLMSELLEGHIRDHVLNGKQRPTSKQVQAADEVIEMVKSYLK